MEIRHIVPSDNKNLISRIYEESWKHAYKGIIPQDYLDNIPEGHWVNTFDIPEWHTMLCIENGEYIGISSYCKSRFEQYPHLGEIISIYFLPEYMRRGYGNRLLEAVMKQLKMLGFEEVFLWVLEENRGARQFYENFGFKCTEDFMNDNIGGKALREIRYIYRFS